MFRDVLVQSYLPIDVMGPDLYPAMLPDRHGHPGIHDCWQVGGMEVVHHGPGTVDGPSEELSQGPDPGPVFVLVLLLAGIQAIEAGTHLVGSGIHLVAVAVHRSLERIETVVEPSFKAGETPVDHAQPLGSDLDLVPDGLQALLDSGDTGLQSIKAFVDPAEFLGEEVDEL